MKRCLFFMGALVFAFSAYLIGEEVSPTAPTTLQVEIKIGTGVEDHEPTGVADTFSSNQEQLTAWTKIKGANEPTTVKHVWIHEGKTFEPILLNVTSSSFRTWSRKTLWELTGQWKLEVRDSSDQLLASKDFQVTQAEKANPGAPVSE